MSLPYRRSNHTFPTPAWLSDRAAGIEATPDAADIVPRMRRSKAPIESDDQAPVPGHPEPTPARLSQKVAIGSITLAALISRWAIPSAALVALGLALLMPNFGRGVGTKAGRVAFGIAGWYAVVGFLLGALPTKASDFSEFVQSDGRFLLVMVLFICTMGIRAERADAILDFLPVVLLVGAIITAIGIFFELAPLMPGGTFMGLTSSHHVPGYFYGMGTLLLAIRKRPFRTQSQRNLVIAIFLAIVLASASRATLLGMMCSMGVWIVSAHRQAFAKRFVVSLMSIAFLIVISPRGTDTLRSLTLVSLGDTIYTQEGETRSTAGLSTADANIVLRFDAFDRAMQLGLDSPIIGAGPFRYNDLQGRFVGVRGLVYVNVGQQPEWNDRSAHNFILQVFAETGLLGIAAFLSLFATLWRRSNEAEEPLEKRDGMLCHLLIAFSFGVGLVDVSLLAAGFGLLAWPVLSLSSAASSIAARNRDGLATKQTPIVPRFSPLSTVSAATPNAER